MNDETELLVMCLLMIIVFVFGMNVRNVEALRLIVQDEDESLINHDFFLSDEDMNVLSNQSTRLEALKQISDATKFKGINYADLKSIKFFYADNGTIVADIVLNKDANYSFVEGTAYGMAINMNPFPNASSPIITDADYIYKYVYNNGTWYKVLAIKHAGGEEKSFRQSRIESDNLNEKENYVRMVFNTGNIGKPDSFQVQFFAWTKATLPNNYTYSLIDVTPWIEVPPPEISLSLDEKKIKVYPGDPPKTIYVKLNSTSSLSKNIDLKFCQDNKCRFIMSTTLTPPTKKTASLPITLQTENIDPSKLHLQLFAYVSPTDAFTVANLPNPKLKVWDLDVEVGNHLLETWQGLTKIPPHILLLLVSIFTFIGGIFINKESLSLRFKKFLESRRKKHA